MKLMPASSARWMMRIDSSWSGVAPGAEHHRAEAERRDLHTRAAERAVLHADTLAIEAPAASQRRQPRTLAVTGFRSPAAAFAAVCATRSRAARLGRLLPLHALPAAIRHGASAQARVLPGHCGSSPGEHLRSFDPGDGGFVKVFCSRCGSALWSRHPTDADTISVRLGTFDADPGVPPLPTASSSPHAAAPGSRSPDDGLPPLPGTTTAGVGTVLELTATCFLILLTALERDQMLIELSVA